jgi:hypothetical protein
MLIYDSDQLVLGPGSFIEVRKVLPLLTSGSPSFHVVALGLPGYGFSEAPKEKGFALAQFAEVSSGCQFRLLALLLTITTGRTQTYAVAWV